MDQVARALVTIAMVAITAPAGSAVPAADPNLYLEQVDGARALTTVKAWNAATLAKLEKQPGFADYRAKALALLSTNQKIAEPDAILGDKVLNYWQDEQHPRGIWRVSPLAAFAAGKPQWRTLLDIDADEQGRRKEVGVQGRELPVASLRRLHGQPFERRRRRRRGARVRPRQGGFHRRRLLPSDRQDRCLLGRPRRAVRRNELRRRAHSPISAMRAL